MVRDKIGIVGRHLHKESEICEDVICSLIRACILSTPSLVNALLKPYEHSYQMLLVNRTLASTSRLPSQPR